MLNKGCIEGTLLRFQFSHLPEGDNLVKNMLKQKVRHKTLQQRQLINTLKLLLQNVSKTVKF